MRGKEAYEAFNRAIVKAGVGKPPIAFECLGKAQREAWEAAGAAARADDDSDDEEDKS
jgi:hypothetical protein